MEESQRKLQVAMDTLNFFKQVFQDRRENLHTYFKENQEVQEWDFQSALVFVRLDGFLGRLVMVQVGAAGVSNEGDEWGRPGGGQTLNQEMSLGRGFLLNATIKVKSVCDLVEEERGAPYPRGALRKWGAHKEINFETPVGLSTERSRGGHGDRENGIIKKARSRILQETPLQSFARSWGVQRVDL